jgi:hypothetical protein
MFNPSMTHPVDFASDRLLRIVASSMRLPGPIYPKNQ